MSDWKQEWIIELYSGNAGERAGAAREIYASGHVRANAATRDWWTNAELRRLLGDQPQVTVGVAVQPEEFAKIRAANGMPRLAEVPAEQDAMEFELHFAGGIALDVLTSREPEGGGAIAKFLAKQGEGVQQVEFRCENVDRATEILREQFGVTRVYAEARPGADGTRVNFFLVAGRDGKKVLIELYQPATGSEATSRSVLT